MRNPSSATQIILRSQLSMNHPEVDSLFANGGIDPWGHPEFRNLLSAAHVFVLEIHDPETLKATTYSYTEGKKTITPVFTSVAQILPYLSKVNLMHYRRVKAGDLASSLPSDSKIHFNPCSPHARTLSTDEYFSWIIPFGTPIPVGPTTITNPTIPEPRRAAEESVIEESLEESFETTAEKPVRKAKTETATTSRTVIRRAAQVMGDDTICPRKIALALNNFCSERNVVDAGYAGLVPNDEGKTLIVGLRLNSIDEAAINDTLAELSVYLDPSIDPAYGIEICLVDESPNLQKALEEKKARQIFVRR